MKEKYYIVLEEYERRMIINSLNELRNRLIADGRYTEAVDEILLKIINAKKKKFKVICGGVIMQKNIYNEQTGISYTLQGDYYLPDLTLPAQKEERHIGIWGQRYLRYIREHKKALYTSLLTSGKLQSYLADVEEQAQRLFDRLMKQRAELEDITETLKACNQMEWIRRMNALRSAVTETVNAEVIFV